MSFDPPLPPYTASDSHATFLNVSCLDLLLIEMVPLAERMARRAGRIERGEELGQEDEGGGVVTVKGDGKKGKVDTKKDEADGGAVIDEELYKDAIFFRLDALGYRVGQGLSERYVFSPSNFSRRRGSARWVVWRCETLRYVHTLHLLPSCPDWGFPGKGQVRELQALERPYSQTQITGQTNQLSSRGKAQFTHPTSPSNHSSGTQTERTDTTADL